MYRAAGKTIAMIHTGVGIPSGRPMPNQPNRSALSLKPVLIGLPLVYTMVTPRSSSIITGGDEGLHAASRYNHPGDCADRRT